jgi:transitional endoplasmic reticulum ATPase
MTESLAEAMDKITALLNKMASAATDKAALVEPNPPQQGETVTARKTIEEKKVLAALRDVAGVQFQQSSIERGGTKLRLPEKMTPIKAISHLNAFIEAEEEVTSFNRTFRYRPWDGAAATERAIRVITGTSGIGKAQQSFFGTTPPARHTINTGVNETIEVPWGGLTVPLFDGTLYLSGMNDPEYGVLFAISAEAPRKYGAEINGLFDLIQTELEERSIYKGKAFDGAEMPEFIDLTETDPTKVIYSDDVMVDLDTNIWSLIKHSDTMREEGVQLKRSVLLHGPYGTGKTLAGALTAQKAVAAGWTFVKARPGKDDPFKVMQTARLYAPSVVFIEDVDSFTRAGSGIGGDQMSLLLDQFDGIGIKGLEVMNIMTTNHKELISKGMLRPGRLDALIEIAELDLGGMTRMVRSLVPEDRLDNVDYEQVYDKMSGYLPAFVAEAVSRAKLASISRGNGKLLPLSTADLSNGAMTLRAQYELMQTADESIAEPTLEKAFKGVVLDAVVGLNMFDVNEDYTSHEIVE